MAVFQGNRHQRSLVHSELEQLFGSDTDLVSPRNRIHSSPERPSARSIPADELPTWELWLQQRGIAVEEKRSWESGG
jgi:hypothetical protein